MAGEENLGSINYSVDVDFQSLVEAGEAQDRFSDKSKEAARGVKKTGRETDKAAKEVKRGSEAMDKSFRVVTRTVQILGAAIGGLTVGRVVSEFSTFEQGMRNVAAVSGATATELEGLTETALMAAASTRFNPGQTTQALYALASSGQDAEEQMASLTNVLNLAEAGQANLGNATELTTSTLNQFGLLATESGRVADVFVASIGASALNVNRLQVALRNAGPTAAALDQSLEGTTATIGLLTTAFGNGERAGTGFRALLNELPAEAESLGVSVRNANGQFRPFVEILEDIEDRGITAGQAVSIFGAEAGPALAALLRNGSEALREMEGELTSNGQAAETAASQLDTLRGDLDALASSTSVAFIAMGDSQSGFLRGSTQTITNLIRLWSGYGDTLGEQRQETRELATVIETTIAAAGGMAAVGVALKAATLAQVAFNSAARANPYILIATTIAGATAAVWAFTNAQESALDVWERAQESEAAYQAALADTNAANRIQEIVQERAELQERLNKAQERWVRNGTEEAAIKEELAELEREYHAITDARIKAEEARNERQGSSDERAREAKEAQLKLQQEMLDAMNAQLPVLGETTDVYAELLRQLDPAQAALNDYFDTLDKIADLDISDRERDRLSEAAYEQHWRNMVEIAGKGGKTAAEEAAEEFENPWQNAADSVAQSLQDAIASGDWDSIGDAIGNSLATSIAGIVNKTITDSLAKDITKNSSALTQISGAFAGPIAGAVVGGAMQLALKEISDYLGDDFDPTEARQARQGTGTVLGSIDAKSRSIAEATETAANAGRELVGINRDMLRALQVVQVGIMGASTRIARGAGDVSLRAPGVMSGRDLFDDLTGGTMPILDETLGLAFDFFDTMGEIFTLGMLDLDSLLGGKSKKKDEGIQIVGGYIGDLIDETLVNAYATFRVKKHALDDYDTKERFSRLGGDVERQFALVFGGIFDSVTLAAEELGVNGAKRLKDFAIETQRISLEGLSAEEQTAELEAYFGTVFDNMAGAAVPFIEEFQRAGEGLGETLARVATEVQVTQEAVDMLGLRFGHLTGEALVEASQRLVEVNGGIEQFASNMQNFTRNFASDLQQFEIATDALEGVVGTIPDTREGFYELVQAQDASTESGARNIANLLRVQGLADQYYDTLESAQKDYFTSEIEGQRERLSEARRANRAVTNALDGMVFQSATVQEASRMRALNTLDRMAVDGRVVAGAELDNALEAATRVEQGDFSTFADYAREFTRTTGTLGRVREVTQRQETNEQRMLDRLERQLEALTGLRQDLERSQLAIIKQSSKTTKILERMELDGIEVRE